MAHDMYRDNPLHLTDAVYNGLHYYAQREMGVDAAKTVPYPETAAYNSLLARNLIQYTPVNHASTDAHVLTNEGRAAAAATFSEYRAFRAPGNTDGDAWGESLSGQ